MKVEEYIAEIERCVRDGRNWCPCVEDDLPKARAALAAGNRSKARYHALEALKRCSGTPWDISGGEAGREVEGAPTAFDFSPIAPLDPMSFILGGR
jgi:hypothetical protein